MKLFLTALATTLIFGSTLAQDCERIVDNCEKLLSKNAKSEFISDGQVYTAFLDRGEVAKFETTLFGGSTYRIAASAGDDEDYVVFTLKDPADNILFTNSNYNNAPYWDFEVEESITVTIETKLDPDLKFSGCVVMLIGFK